MILQWKEIHKLQLIDKYRQPLFMKAFDTFIAHSIPILQAEVGWQGLKISRYKPQNALNKDNNH